MSNSNGKIYVSSPYGVSIADVKAVLNESSTDLGTLCKSNKINRWAKYKPMRKDGPLPIFFAYRKAYHFGLSLPFCNDDIMNDLAHDVLTRTNTSGWSYLQPRGDMTGSGGVKEFYRLSDFVRYPTDSADPNTGQHGYNHNAGLPFRADVIMDGITEKTDSFGKYYEVKKQVTSAIRVVFTNSSVDGDDIHLQDLVDVSGSYGTGIKWRPVAQIYKENFYGPEDRWWLWGGPQLELGGLEIGSSLNVPAEISIDLTNSLFTQNPNAIFHVCLGVGCCDGNASQYYDNDNSLFLLPYEDTRSSTSDWLPFYFRFKLVNDPGRQLYFTNLKYRNSSNQWVDAGGSGYYFEIPKAYMQGTAVGLTFTISEQPSQPLLFMKINETSQTYDTLKLKADESLNYQTSTDKYLEPANPNNNWSVVSGGVLVPAGPTTTTTELYAIVDIDKQNAQVGDVLAYHLWAQIASASWAEIGYFSIKMT